MFLDIGNTDRRWSSQDTLQARWIRFGLQNSQSTVIRDNPPSAHGQTSDFVEVKFENSNSPNSASAESGAYVASRLSTDRDETSEG